MNKIGTRNIDTMLWDVIRIIQGRNAFICDMGSGKRILWKKMTVIIYALPITGSQEKKHGKYQKSKKR